MPRIIWPLTLPQSPQLENYKETRPSHILRSSTEYGPAKVRARGGNKPIVVEATYIMTDEQISILDTFIYDVDGLAGGVRCFDWLRPKWGHVGGTNNPVWSRANRWDASAQPVLASEGSYVRARIVPSGEDSMYDLSVIDTVKKGTSQGNYTTSQIWSVILRLEIFPNVPPTSYTVAPQ